MLNVINYIFNAFSGTNSALCSARTVFRYDLLNDWWQTDTQTDASLLQQATKDYDTIPLHIKEN